MTPLTLDGCITDLTIERSDSMLRKPVYPNPYNYDSDVDYYEALDEYYRLMSPEYEAEEIDRAYDEYVDRMLTQQENISTD